MQANGTSTESSPPPGVVELREDVPLKVGASFGAESSRCCGGGPRFILACFAALTAGITLALLTQIYYGDYELVPHGSVSSSAANCSRAGTDALKAGGRAMDAAAAAALCLAVLLPHRTSLDASGSLLYWEYRITHSQSPVLYEWGDPEIYPWTNSTDRPPKMLAAFAYLHATHGVLPWSRIVQPAIAMAKDNMAALVLSKSVSLLAAENPDSSTVSPAILQMNANIANYLQKFQHNTSAELAMLWESDRLILKPNHLETPAGSWKVYTGSAGVVAASALARTFIPPLPDPDAGFRRVVSNLQQLEIHEDWPSTEVASGLAVVDRLDTYIALATGLSQPYGSGPVSPNGWMYDDPNTALDLAPAIIVAQHICGIRYIIGAETSSALAQAATALLTSEIGVGAVENPRVTVYGNGIIAIEAEKGPPEALPTAIPANLVNATLPYPAVNVIMQNGDALMSHADSRGGGLASRF